MKKLLKQHNAAYKTNHNYSQKNKLLNSVALQLKNFESAAIQLHI
jgi:hypothetical protein